MDENSVKINCDFCSMEIECPKDMLEKAKKHMCYECFYNRVNNGSNEDLKDVHVDFPTKNLIEETAGKMVDEMVESVFQKMWDSRKKEFEEMTKKDLAYEMLGTGAYIALSNIMKLQYEQAKKEIEGTKK